MLAVGVLIAGTSGLCSAGFVLWAIVAAAGTADAGMAVLYVIPAVLIVGGIPFAIGFGLIQWGRSLLRNSEQA